MIVPSLPSERRCEASKRPRRIHVRVDVSLRLSRRWMDASCRRLPCRARELESFPRWVSFANVLRNVAWKKRRKASYCSVKKLGRENKRCGWDDERMWTSCKTFRCVLHVATSGHCKRTTMRTSGDEPSFHAKLISLESKGEEHTDEEDACHPTLSFSGLFLVSHDDPTFSNACDVPSRVQVQIFLQGTLKILLPWKANGFLVFSILHAAFVRCITHPTNGTCTDTSTGKGYEQRWSLRSDGGGDAHWTHHDIFLCLSNLPRSFFRLELRWEAKRCVHLHHEGFLCFRTREEAWTSSQVDAMVALGRRKASSWILKSRTCRQRVVGTSKCMLSNEKEGGPFVRNLRGIDIEPTVVSTPHARQVSV